MKTLERKIKGLSGRSGKRKHDLKSDLAARIDTDIIYSTGIMSLSCIGTFGNCTPHLKQISSKN